VIALVVDESTVILGHKQEVKNALLMTIRDIVYNGTEPEIQFLRKLSNTYMMLFLLQCDPKLSLFFSTMAAKLKVYVCSSILVPAMSEYYLPRINRRYWNLLRGAHDVGVTLLVNEVIVSEIAAHFKMIATRYANEFSSDEALYLDDEMRTLYVDEIMIRAYLYAKSEKLVPDFGTFLETFVSPSYATLEDDIIAWLAEEFGIRYQASASLGVVIDQDDENRLFYALKAKKPDPASARAKSKLVLTLLALRERNNEKGDAGIFGYETWWLSLDTATQRAVDEVFQGEYAACCMRSDFLYNYISLAPKQAEIEGTFRAMFPSLIGINLSHHFPSEVVSTVHQQIAAHRAKNPARVRAILRDLAHRLQSDPKSRTRKAVKLYLDEELDKIAAHDS